MHQRNGIPPNETGTSPVLVNITIEDFKSGFKAVSEKKFHRLVDITWDTTTERHYNQIQF